MNRVLTSGIVVSALTAILPACGEDDGRCQFGQRLCDFGCVDLMADPNNCGNCTNECGTAQTCVVGVCKESCEAPNVECGAACVDTQTAAAHCGACDAACPTGIECASGRCAVPLALMQTSVDDRTIDRDLFVLQDATLDLTKLNTSAFATSRVVDSAVLPDGSVVFVAAETTEDVFELFHAKRDGSIVKLNPPLVAGGDVLPGVKFSADGTKLLYRADQISDDTIDLFAVELATPGTAIRVNDRPIDGGPQPTGRVSRVFELSTDGSRATFISDQETQGFDELFTVDLSGAQRGPNIKINAPGATSVMDMDASSDGTTVVYRADHAVVGIPQLFVVEVENPGVAEIITNPEGNYHADGYRITPDDIAIVYTGSQFFVNEKLWRVPLVAPPLTSELLVDANNGFLRPSFTISDDSVRIYFSTGDERVGVVSIITPNAPTLLVDPKVERVTDFVLSRDERSMVARAGADGGEGGFGTPPGTQDPDLDALTAPRLIYIDLQAPGAPVVVSAPVDLKADEGIRDGYFVTDDRRVLYRADHDAPGRTEVFLVGLDTPGEVTKVSPPLDATTDSTDISILSRF